MWHKVSTSYVGGNTEDINKALNMLNAGDKAVANAFTAKTGKSIEEALEVMKNETWYSAQEAVDVGLCEGVMFEEQNTMNMYNSYSNGIIPEEIINKMQDEQLQNKNKEVQTKQLKNRLQLLELKGGII